MQFYEAKEHFTENVSLKVAMALIFLNIAYRTHPHTFLMIWSLYTKINLNCCIHIIQQHTEELSEIGEAVSTHINGPRQVWFVRYWVWFMTNLCHSFTDNVHSHLLTLERNNLRNSMAVRRREIWVSLDVYACLLTVWFWVDYVNAWLYHSYDKIGLMVDFFSKE